MRGESKALLTVNNTIDIKAKGESELSYRGNAEITHEDLSGNSKIFRTN